jgi:hypothetical protein
MNVKRNGGRTWPFVRSINRMEESRDATNTESFGAVGDTTTLVTGASHRQLAHKLASREKKEGPTPNRIADQFPHPYVVAPNNPIDAPRHDLRAASRGRRDTDARY